MSARRRRDRAQFTNVEPEPTAVKPTIVREPEPTRMPTPTITTRRRIYDTDRLRRDPTAFADVDPDYVEQIELRQDVQQLGRAYQNDPSDVAQARLQTKYDEYIDVRKKRGAVVPSADIQYRATHPRSAEDLRALRDEPVAVQPVTVTPAIVEPAPQRPSNTVAGYIALAALISFGLAVRKGGR